MNIVNLGILAHVDAGKTSLTERLLYAAGVIDEVGSVDAGSTQTDSLALERQRGITIKSAVVSFVIDDVTVNLIDTPGHPDFIAEVERVLGVLDGAVLVLSAVEGVQAQTRVLMRTLQRLRIPTLIFVNKIDRAGARYEDVLRSITERLAPAAVPMGSVSGLGTRDAVFTPFGPTDAGHVAGLGEVLAEHDDALLAAYVDDEAAVSFRQAARRARHADTAGGGASGVLRLGDDGRGGGLALRGDQDAAARGGEATSRARRRAPCSRSSAARPGSGSPTSACSPAWCGPGTGCSSTGAMRGRSPRSACSIAARPSRSASVSAGQIGMLWGLGEVRIGDTIGRSRPSAAHSFAPPTLETIVVPCRPTDRGMLHVALTQLAEQDPLIGFRRDQTGGELAVSLYGDVQKEVIQATLANDFDVEVGFRETTTICIERPIGTGAAVEIMDKDPNPFLATVGLRVDPAPLDTGIEFRLEVELGSMPYAFFKAVEDTVRDTLEQGATTVGGSPTAWSR